VLVTSSLRLGRRWSAWGLYRDSAQASPRWPPFAKGSVSGSWTGFAALLACGDHYRALARSATIPGDRPVRPDFEKPHLPSLPQQGGWTN
jgi:hypothetical protein